MFLVYLIVYVSDILPFSFELSGTDSALYPYDPEQGYFKNLWFPTTNLYPYFLFPPTTRPHRMPAPHGTAHTVGTLTYRTHRTGTAIVTDNQVNVEKTFNNTIKYPGFSIPTFTDQGETDFQLICKHLKIVFFFNYMNIMCVYV